MGVYCGKLMADMGADVIKVEPPGGDSMRRIGPFLAEPLFKQKQGHGGSSLHWLHFNANKRSITLDIATADGRSILRRLACRADVVLESYPPGHMESLGLNYASLEAENPRLIYTSITSFGLTGPHKDFKASDLVGLAMGGYLYVTGWPHTPPTRLWGSQAYHTVSNRAYIAILLALYHRLATGLGQHIDVSMQEAVAATTEHVNTTFNYEGMSAVRCGFRHGGQFIATWRCKDGFVSITTNTQQAWDDLRDWMRRDGMAGDLMDAKYDDRFILRGDLSQHIEALIQEWALSHTREEITELGQARHHPWGPVATESEILENPQLWNRGFFVEQEHGDAKTSLIYPGAPYKFSQSTWQLRHVAPDPGQHNREIYCGELGFTASDLEALAGAGVI